MLVFFSAAAVVLANMSSWIDVGMMLAQHHRLWTDMIPTSIGRIHCLPDAAVCLFVLVLQQVTARRTVYLQAGISTFSMRDLIMLILDNFPEKCCLSARFLCCTGYFIYYLLICIMVWWWAPASVVLIYAQPILESTVSLMATGKQIYM